jgi:glutathione synthase/RimK-type ligase-like ATP-grasp enzyme
MRREMDAALTERIATAQLPCADRVGLAKLTTMAASGVDLRPLWHALIAKLMEGTIEAGEGLDLSLIAQLLGDKEAGLAIQHEILKSHQLFRSRCSMQQQPPLRVLALAAATDMGSNTPIEFLLEHPGVELMTLYVIPEVELPQPLPEHDIAIVIASDSEDCRDALRMIENVAARWPRPLLNPPHRVGNLDRDKLHGLLLGIEGLEIPATIAVTRTQLSDLPHQAAVPRDIASDLAFPIIARPRGSHAGKGLAKIDDASALENYLGERQEQEFFVSRFVDYSGDDGLFRKFRIVIVDGKPYACHLAVADRWDIWYLNAGMTQSAGKRLEEETFMHTFDIGFARRHATALAGMIDRIGLDYFMVDCAETKHGSLLIFEADNTAIVHNMDPPEIFPYKAPQMRKVFDAFAAMLERRARHAREQAA